MKVVNFEAPLKPSKELPYQKRERFYQNDDAPSFLRNLGFNLFQIANNHAFDWGDEGFLKTKRALGDSAFGAGSYDDAYKVKVVEAKGIRVGFMALSFSAYTGVFDNVTDHDGLGCAYINDLRVNHDIIEAKKKVDYLFILPHDGIEYIDVPLPETIARYHDFIDYGADGVIGTHTHCPQGWETYKNKPIFYSLGNFLFNSKEGYDYRATNRPHWYEGLCAVIKIDDGALSWEVVNTRNVDNVAISIDHAEERDVLNNRNCRYLIDREGYWSYFDGVCESIGYGNLLSIVDASVHPQNLKSVASKFVRILVGAVTKRNLIDNQPLIRLLSHDGNRQLLKWSLMRHSKEKKL